MKKLAIGTVALLGLLGLWVAKRKPKPPPVVVPIVQSVYPRSAAYAAMGSMGAPYAGNDSLTRSLARYDVVSLDAARGSGPAADVVRLLKSTNPGMTLLAYHKAGRFFVCGGGWYGQTAPAPGCDTTFANAAWSRFTVIRRHNAIVQSTHGGPWRFQGPDPWVDFTRPGFPEEYADTLAAWSGPDGDFLDELAYGIGGPWGEGDTIRFSPYASFNEWNAAYRAGVELFVGRLRDRIGTKYIVTNYGPQGSRQANGILIENLPYQAGGTVIAYLERESLYTAPRLNWMTAWPVNGNPADPENVRKARYALGVACMGSGVGTLTWSAPDKSRGAFMWLPEYEPRGWLGSPLGRPYLVNQGVRRDFTGGMVYVDTVAQTATFVR